MAQLMIHKNHGLHIARYPQEQKAMEAIGWEVCKEHPGIAKSKALEVIEPKEEEDRPKRGRPSKGQ